MKASKCMLISIRHMMYMMHMVIIILLLSTAPLGTEINTVNTGIGVQGKLRIIKNIAKTVKMVKNWFNG